MERFSPLSRPPPPPFSFFLLYHVTGTGNPWAGQVIDTEAELAVGLTTFMSAFVNFGFALDTGSDQKSYVRATTRRGTARDPIFHSNSFFIRT